LPYPKRNYYNVILITNEADGVSGTATLATIAFSEKNSYCDIWVLHITIEEFHHFLADTVNVLVAMNADSSRE
jgi:hypothetical protein